MQNHDLFFHYKYVCRNMLINRFANSYSTLEIPQISHLLIFFSVKDIEDIDDVRAFNYLYLCRYFFGRKAFFRNYKCIFNRGVYYYSYNVEFIVKTYDLYYIIFFFVNDLKPYLNSDFVKISVLGKTISISVLDTNIFLEKKNNYGLFDLKDAFNINIFYNASCMFFDMFKL